MYIIYNVPTVSYSIVSTLSSSSIGIDLASVYKRQNTAHLFVYNPLYQFILALFLNYTMSINFLFLPYDLLVVVKIFRIIYF